MRLEGYYVLFLVFGTDGCRASKVQKAEFRLLGLHYKPYTLDRLEPSTEKT